MSFDKSWRCVELLPKHSGQDWAVWHKHRVTTYDTESSAMTALSTWHPQKNTLVATPNSLRFAPPVYFDCFAEKLRLRYQRMAALSAACWGAMGFFALVLFFLKRGPLVGGIAIVFSMVMLASVMDALKLRNLTALKERALFYYWLSETRTYKIGFAVWFLLLLGIGGLQWQLQHAMGDYEIVLRTWGSMYVDIQEGQLWRLLTGPFFHSHLVHYISNLVFALVVGPITWAVLGARSFLIFLLGNVAGALAQTYLGSGRYDVYTGISGGLYALLGTLITWGALDRRVLPQGFTLLCIWFTLISLVAAEVLASNAATTAHMGGFIAGAGWALVEVFFEKLKNLSRFKDFLSFKRKKQVE